MNHIEEFNTNLPSMHHGRHGCAAAALGGKIFVVGGWDEKSGEVYNVAAKQWNPIKPMGIERWCSAAVSFGDSVVVMGGSDGIDYLSSVEEYNTLSQKWLSFPEMNTKRWGCAAAVVDGKIIAVGGYDGTNYLTSAEEYDPNTQKWSKISPMHVKRSGCVAAVLDGQLYVIGGYNKVENKVSFLSCAEVYNPQTNQWMLIDNMTTPRSNFAAVSFGEKIIVIGGYDGKGKLSSCESYDVTKHRWSKITSMNTKREGCAAVEVKGTLYVIGGSDKLINYLPSMESLNIKQICSQPSSPTTTRCLVHQISVSQLPQTMQLFREKIPTSNFTPVAAEVVPMEEACVSESLESMSSTEDLSKSSTEEICRWLSNHGISTISLDILRREEIDGVFLFTESYDMIYRVLKEEGMKAGQISRIRHSIEKAKAEGSLI